MPFTRAFAPAFAFCTLALGAGLAAHAQGVPGSTEAAACQEHKLFGDERRFECSAEAKAGDKPPRLVMLFSGSHDDTMASLKLQADGRDIACGAGSKTETMGEDGRVSLLCHLPVDAVSPGRHTFTVFLRWTHAEYEGFRLER